MSEFVPHERHEEAVALRDGGATFSQIGRALGVSKTEAFRIHSDRPRTDRVAGHSPNIRTELNRLMGRYEEVCERLAVCERQLSEERARSARLHAVLYPVAEE